MYRKHWNPNCKCNGNRRDKATLKTTSTKNVKFKIIKTRTGCQHIRYFYYSKILNWAAQNIRPGYMRPAGWTLLACGVLLLGLHCSTATVLVLQQKSKHNKMPRKVNTYTVSHSVQFFIIHNKKNHTNSYRDHLALLWIKNCRAGTWQIQLFAISNPPRRLLPNKQMTCFVAQSRNQSHRFTTTVLQR